MRGWEKKEYVNKKSYKNEKNQIKINKKLKSFIFLLIFICEYVKIIVK